MRFFLDANIPYSALEVFKELNLEAVHAKDVGLGRASDDEILSYATKNKCILVTKDLEFANITVFPPKAHYGLVILRLPYFFKSSQFVGVLKNFLSSVKLEDLERAVSIVKLGGYRLRKI